MPGKIIPGLTEETTTGDDMQLSIYNSLVAAITDRTRYMKFSTLYDYIYGKLTAAVLRMRIGDATTAQSGVVERCTDTEAQTGTDTTRYVTADHLRRFGAAALAIINVTTGSVASGQVQRTKVVCAAIIRVHSATDDIRADFTLNYNSNSAFNALHMYIVRLDGGYTASSSSFVINVGSNRTVSGDNTWTDPGIGVYCVLLTIPWQRGIVVNAGTTLTLTTV